MIINPPPKAPWYESNIFWGPLTIVIAIILTLIPTFFHDLRWLLWVALPLCCLSIWWVAGRTREPWLITILGSLIAAAFLFGLGVWLGHRPIPAAITPVSIPAGVEKKANEKPSTQPQPVPTKQIPHRQPASPATKSSIQQAPNDHGCNITGGTDIDCHPEDNRQYGPRKLAITQAQSLKLAEMMKPYSGVTVEVTAKNATPDSEAYARELVEIMSSAGVKAFYHPMMSTSACSIPGVTLTWKATKPPISDVLRDVLQSDVAVHEGQAMWIDPADLYVWICPNQ